MRSDITAPVHTNLDSEIDYNNNRIRIKVLWVVREIVTDHIQLDVREEGG